MTGMRATLATEYPVTPWLFAYPPVFLVVAAEELESASWPSHIFGSGTSGSLPAGLRDIIASYAACLAGLTQTPRKGLR